MVAAMAIELFVWLYALSFGVVTVIAVVLLVSAARYIGRLEKERQAANDLAAGQELSISGKPKKSVTPKSTTKT